jgi:hypothetical protein
MYAYGVRNVGNPELHKAFEKKLDRLISYQQMPYRVKPFLFLLLLFLLF